VKKALAAALTLGLGAAAFAAVPSNTYVRMILDTLPDLDPTQSYDTASNEAVLNMYETLVTYKGTSVKDLEPLLATEWKPSNNGRTWTFTLRKNVKFHSGNAFTCEDAEYTFERALVVNPSDGWAGTVLGGALLDSNANANDDKSITWAKIDKAVECNSAGQLVFNLVKPDASFLAKMAFTAAGIIDKKFAVAGGEWGGTEKDWKQWVGKSLHESYLSNKASGTGAYQMVSKSATTYAFKAFDGYWGGKPKIENVLLQVVGEEAARVQALQRGDADLIDLSSRPSLAVLKNAKGVKVLDNLEGLSVDFISLNQNVKAGSKVLGSGKLDGNGIPANFFSDVNVRKGFALAFDYNTYLNQVLQGSGKRLTMALPASFLGYDPTIKPPAFNLEAAKAALQKAWNGDVWKNGFTVQVWYNAGNTRRQSAAEILKTNLEKLNPKFHLEVSQHPFAEVIQEGDQGRLAMTVAGWSPDYADPDDFMPIFYASNGYYSARTGINDKTIDSALNQAAETTDVKKRESLYKLVGRRANDIYPFILLPARVEFRAIREEVKGYTFNPMLLNSDVYWKDLSK
jgi:peptide/nickel transport system substrate-binding protein